MAEYITIQSLLMAPLHGGLFSDWLKVELLANEYFDSTSRNVRFVATWSALSRYRFFFVLARERTASHCDEYLSSVRFCFML